VALEASASAANVNERDCEQRWAAAFARAKRREALLGVGFVGLAHFFEAGEVAHSVVAEAGQSDVTIECGLGEHSRGTRQQHLAAVDSRPHPRRLMTTMP
jgi:hypothetical protein